jgi:hypothetical protein
MTYIKVYNAVSDKPIKSGNLNVLSMDLEYNVMSIITEIPAIK